jgi:phosphopantetheinyl transferase
MFADQEAKTMSVGDEREIQNKFFDFWTLREAYVKALGTGLGGSSKEFYFTVDTLGASAKDVRKAEIHFIDSKMAMDLHWQFSLLTLSLDHVAAIAIETSGLDKKIVSQKIQP